MEPVTGYVILIDGIPDWDTARMTLEEVVAECDEFSLHDWDVYKYTATFEFAAEVLSPETKAERAAEAPDQRELF